MVTSVTVDQLTATSVRVFWDKIPVDGITGYAVYYTRTGNKKRQSDLSIIVSNSIMISVKIGNLSSNVEYQFQVAALAEFQGDTIEGERSVVDDKSRIVIIKLYSGVNYI